MNFNIAIDKLALNPNSKGVRRTAWKDKSEYLPRNSFINYTTNRKRRLKVREWLDGVMDWELVK